MADIRNTDESDQQVALEWTKRARMLFHGRCCHYGLYIVLFPLVMSKVAPAVRRSTLTPNKEWEIPSRCRWLWWSMLRECNALCD